VPETAAWRQRVHTVIFEADTPGGKAFDVALFLAILASITIVCLDTVEPIAKEYGRLLFWGEWFFTGLFTIEYVLRLLCVRRPLRYARSFFGIVDLLSVLPTWLTLAGGGPQALLLVRAFRLLRIFRVFKLGRFVSEATVLRRALLQSRAKVTVFLSTVLVIVVVTGAALYLVEGKDSGFSSIPQSMYWAIVTLTTVGYGDVAPVTPLGKALAAVLMLLGYSLIIVPTGILAAGLARAERETSTQACPSCMAEGHDRDAIHCKRCGARL
jgi:voltage-gated potassium channel